MMNRNVNALSECYKLAEKLHNAFNRDDLDRLFCVAYDNGINVYTDYETYVYVEDERFEVIMFQ